MGESKTRKRPSVQPIIQRYLNEGFDMRDIVTEITPEGGLRVYVKSEPKGPPVMATGPLKTDWKDAPAFK